MHHATLAAFERYRKTATKEAIYYFWALEKRIIDEFDLTVDDPHVTIDVSATWASKGQARRMYASQEDAQEIADMMEMFDDRNEVFPPVPASARFDDLFHA